MKTTIPQGIAHNKLRHLNQRRPAILKSFNHLAANHRDQSGIYRRGASWHADWFLSKLEEIDAEISKWKEQLR